MSGTTEMGWLLPAAVGLAAGLVLGRIYFALLWLGVEHLVVGGRPRGTATAFVLRLGAATIALALLGTWNLAAVLGAVGGFTVARYRATARIVERVS